MKKRYSQLITVFLFVIVMAAACALLFGCVGKNGNENTTKPYITLSEATTTTAQTQPTGPAATTLPDVTNPPVVTTAATTAPVIPVGSYINPLTGVPTTKDLSNTRPLAVVIDNHSNAIARQTGLTQADILYEGLVAPGITRFMAVIADSSSISPLCNVRSGRDFNYSWAGNHNSVLVCHGGPINTSYNFYELAVRYFGTRWGFIDTQWETNIFGKDSGAAYGTINHYDARNELKYDTILNQTAVNVLKSQAAKYVRNGGTFSGAPLKTLNFMTYGVAPAMTGASSAANVSLSFKMTGNIGTETVTYSYDATTKKYYRYQNGAAHVDSATKVQLSFTNLLVIVTDVTALQTGIKNDPVTAKIRTEGTGTGYYFTGGNCIAVRWSKSTTFGAMTITDTNGNVLNLACGNTYIGYLNSVNDVTYR